MCYICRTAASMAFRRTSFIACRSHSLRRLSGVSGGPAICSPAATVAATCEPQLLPRRIHRPWLPANGVASRDVRAKFLEFFSHQRGHTVVPSSTLVARNSEGSFFVNAGVNQFKPRVLGEPGALFGDLTRAASVQRCLRVGGKHNDLDAVGCDGTHHTYFEMLGNWSFGDYWKPEACEMAWKFLTEEMRLPASQLYITYFGGCPELGLAADSETRDIWLRLGVSDQRLMPFGVEHNFWEMGDTGPCGPCTEIHFDHVGGRCARCFVNSGLPDVVELWNLVFMSHNRPTPGGALTPLRMKTVDTGMGFERLTAVMQGATSNYDSDIFSPLFACLSSPAIGAPEYSGAVSPRQPNYRRDASLRVIADHARALTVAIGDGLTPSGRGVGHKLRQLAIRAALHSAHGLGLRPGVLGRLAPLVARSLAPDHPETAERAERLASDILLDEEAAVLDRLSLDRLTPASLSEVSKSPERLAELLSSGCAIETVKFFSELHSVSIATGTIESARALLLRKPSVNPAAVAIADFTAGLRTVAESFQATETSPRYECRRVNDNVYEFPPLSARLIGLVVQDNPNSTPTLVPVADVAAASAGGPAVFAVLDRTNFYCDAGGQISDRAALLVPGQPALAITEGFEVSGRVFHRLAAPSTASHPIRLSASSQPPVTVSIDHQHRLGVMQHHTATHLIAEALARIIGPEEARQRSSSVRPDCLTFGFGGRVFGDQEVAAVEAECRRLIEANLAVTVEMTGLKQVVADVKRLPSSEYGESVRVVRVTGDGGAELCSGTHVASTGDLGDILILSVSSSGRGQRELRALAGPPAAQARRTGERLLEEAESAAAALEASQAGAREQLAAVRRLLDGQILIGRLHRSAVQRALSSTPKAAAARADANAEVAGRVVAEVLAGTSCRVRRLDVTRSVGNGVGVKRAILRAVTGNAEKVFNVCDYLVLTTGDSIIVLSSKNTSPNLEQLLSLKPSRSSGGSDTLIFEAEKGRPECTALADVLDKLEQGQL